MHKFSAFAAIIAAHHSFAFQLRVLPFSTRTLRSSSMTTSKMSSDYASSSEGNLLLSKFDALSNDGPRRLILASQSPRRREILDMMGLSNRYIVTFSPLDEEALQIELAKTPISPIEYTKKLAESKAFALAEQMVNSKDIYDHEVSFILGSDTIVDKDGVILEKPKSEEQAIEMLSTLSNSWHEVHTGVALYKMNHSDGSNAIELVSSFTETAKVKFTKLSENDIHAYVKTGEPMDKAGSYGIQGIGGQMIECMEGDFFAVMGLPMHRLSQELARAL
jgi:septum formation protein